MSHPAVPGPGNHALCGCPLFGVERSPGGPIVRLGLTVGPSFILPLSQCVHHKEKPIVSTAPPRWVNEQHAAELVERSTRTLQAWRKAGEVIAYSHGNNRVMYCVGSLRDCRNRMVERYRTRPTPGRPRNTD